MAERNPFEGLWVVKVASMNDPTLPREFAYVMGGHMVEGQKAFVLAPGARRHGEFETLSAKPYFWIPLALGGSQWQVCTLEGDPVFHGKSSMEPLTLARIASTMVIDWTALGPWEPPTDKPAATEGEELGSW